MVITVAVIGVIATVAIPAREPNDELTLSLATTSIANALRFSREQASLTGSMYGISVDTIQQELSIFRLDQTQDPPVSVFDVYHPVSKQLYSIKFATAPFETVTVSEPRVKAATVCLEPSSLVFNADSSLHCLDPLAARLLGASITVELEGSRGSVTVDGYTGRVY